MVHMCLAFVLRRTKAYQSDTGAVIELLCGKYCRVLVTLKRFVCVILIIGYKSST